MEKQQNTAPIGTISPLSSKSDRPQEYYEQIKKKFAEERDLRLSYRPVGIDLVLREFPAQVGGILRRPFGPIA